MLASVYKCKHLKVNGHKISSINRLLFKYVHSMLFTYGTHRTWQTSVKCERT